MRILVVEDERAIADFLQRGLEAEGYAVRCVHDGLEGEALGSSGDFDLVILDLMLPGRPGLEVLRELRRMQPALPVILLTAKGEVEDRVEGLDSGATDYISKPLWRTGSRGSTAARPTTSASRSPSPSWRRG
jgi:DNA-binding response OmpR family regulator